MSSDKSIEVAAPRTATQGSLLSQWWTLGDIILDRRTNGSGRHIKVAWVIIDRHMQAKGNSRASVRFIEQATGLSKGIIIKACRELVEWGYMTQRIGIGTRPTEFIPNWSSVSPASNAKDILSSVPQESNASVPPESNTTDFSVPPESNESYLPDTAYKACVQVGRNIDTLDAMPPAGLAPAEAGTRAPKGFDELYKAYGLRRKRAEAKAVYGKIAPDAGLRSCMVEAAGLWHSSYEKNGTDIKWRKHLHSWLAKECWEEDPPVAYVDAKESAIAKAKDRGSNPARGAKQVACTVVKSGINDMYIVGVSQEGGAAFDEHRVTLELEYADTGERITHELHVHDVNGPGSGHSAWVGLNKEVNWSFNIADIKGYAVKVANGTDGTISFGKSFLPPKEETVEVMISSAAVSPVEPESDEECLEIRMMTDDDVTFEWFAMLKSNDIQEQADDQKRIASMLTAVGVKSVDDERDLIGKRLKIIRQGKGVKEFLPHPSMMKMAA